MYTLRQSLLTTIDLRLYPSRMGIPEFLEVAWGHICEVTIEANRSRYLSIASPQYFNNGPIE